jgi:hypothetical protein
MNETGMESRSLIAARQGSQNPMNPREQRYIALETILKMEIFKVSSIFHSRNYK